MKNTTKLAKVCLVDELPLVAAASPPYSSSPTDKNGSQSEEVAHLGSLTNPPNNKSSFNNDRLRQGSHSQQYQGKPLLYYPEENHLPDEPACNAFNARIMKHIMKQKMQKNETFYASKVLNGDNHFL